MSIVSYTPQGHHAVFTMSAMLRRYRVTMTYHPQVVDEWITKCTHGWFAADDRDQNHYVGIAVHWDSPLHVALTLQLAIQNKVLLLNLAIANEFGVPASLRDFLNNPAVCFVSFTSGNVIEQKLLATHHQLHVQATIKNVRQLLPPEFSGYRVKRIINERLSIFNYPFTHIQGDLSWSSLFPSAKMLCIATLVPFCAVSIARKLGKDQEVEENGEMEEND